MCACVLRQRGPSHTHTCSMQRQQHHSRSGAASEAAARPAPRRAHMTHHRRNTTSTTACISHVQFAQSCAYELHTTLHTLSLSVISARAGVSVSPPVSVRRTVTNTYVQNTGHLAPSPPHPARAPGTPHTHSLLTQLPKYQKRNMSFVAYNDLRVRFLEPRVLLRCF